MKKFLLLIAFAAITGVSVAWLFSYSRFGHLTPRFGPLTYDGAVTAANVGQILGDPQNTKRAKLVLPGGDSYDFGSMEVGETGTHTFTIRNQGDADLELRVYRTSCICTAGEIKNDIVSPGDETEVTLRWAVESDNFSFHQQAEMISNDPTMPKFALSVGGRVVREMEMVPRGWTFGEVTASEPIELEASFYSFNEFEIEPTEITFPDKVTNELAEYEIEEYEPNEERDGQFAKANQAFRVNVTIQPGLSQGPISQRIRFTYVRKNGIEKGDLSTKDIYHFPVPISGRIVGALGMIKNSKLQDLDGSYVYSFGRIRDGDKLTAKALLTLKGNERNDTELEIGKIKPEGILRATIGEPTGRGTMVVFPINLEIVPGKEDIVLLGNSSTDIGFVEIQSKNPKVPGIRLFVRFAVDGQR